MAEARHISLFKARRTFLTGLAYRILGSVAEAEDAVQDTFLKWSQADRSAIQNPLADHRLHTPLHRHAPRGAAGARGLRRRLVAGADTDHD